MAPWLLAGAGYLALTLFFTWPLAARLRTVLPHDIGDPLFATWLLWWNAHVVPLSAHWWNAPFYWPASGAMGLSEHLLGLSLVATPLQWAGAEPVAAYNILFLLSFPLSALAMHAFVFTLVRRHDAAALAGLLFAFGPYRMAKIAHIQMLWTFWMPIALLALHQYLRDGRTRWLVLFGAMWIGQAASNGYLLLFFPVLIACWVAWFLVSRGDFSRALVIVAAAAIASIPLLPILIAYRRIHAQLSLGRTLDEVRQFSADLTALATTSPSVWTWRRLLPTQGNEQELFPGLTAIALILAAVVVSVWRGRHQPASYPRAQKVLSALACLLVLVAATPSFVGPWRVSVGGTSLLSVSSVSKPLTLAIWCALGAVIAGVSLRRAVAQRSLFGFYMVAAVVMYVCSLGPEPAYRGAVFWYKPPYSWLMELPGYASVRVPARFAMLGMLCLATAAALALTRLTGRLPRRHALAVGIACCGVALVDSWIDDVPLLPLPQRIASLEASGDAGAVVELPLGEVESDLAAMYRSMYHGRPVVNGYGGFRPASHVILRVALDEGDVHVLDAIPGPLTVVVDEAGGRRISVRQAAPIAAPPPSTARLAIRSVTASSDVDLQDLSDDDPISTWKSSGPQRGDEWVTFDLGAVRRVAGLMLAIGPAFSDYARTLAIDASLDGQAWTTVFDGPSAARAVSAALQDARMVPVAYWFPPSDARWIRARQTGRTDTYPWSISEAAIYGP